MGAILLEIHAKERKSSRCFSELESVAYVTFDGRTYDNELNSLAGKNSATDSSLGASVRPDITSTFRPVALEFATNYGPSIS